MSFFILTDGFWAAILTTWVFWQLALFTYRFSKYSSFIFFYKISPTALFRRMFTATLVKFVTPDFVNGDVAFIPVVINCKFYSFMSFHVFD